MDECAVIDEQDNPGSASVMLTGMLFIAMSSVVVWSGISEIVGVSFSGLTEKVKVCELVSEPSEIENVTSAVPKAFAIGVMVPIHEGQVPLHSTALAAATKFESPEV